MKISEIMTSPVITVTPATSIAEAVRLMLQHRISGLPVLDGKEVVGIITEGDLLRRAETGSAPHPPFRTRHGSRRNAMHNPTREVRNEPFPLCFDRQDLTVQFPKPTDAAFWHCRAPLPKFVEASRQKIEPRLVAGA